MDAEAAARWEKWISEWDTEYDAYVNRMLALGKRPCSREVIFHTARSIGEEPVVLLRARRALGEP